MLVGVVVLAVVAFIVLKPSDDKNKTASSTQTHAGDDHRRGRDPREAGQARAAAGDADRGEGRQAGRRDQDDHGGQGRPGALRGQLGRGDEIHVHGYDFMKDVEAGGKVSFSFPAKIDGEFEVELEDRGEQIAKLVVNP